MIILRRSSGYELLFEYQSVGYQTYCLDGMGLKLYKLDNPHPLISVSQTLPIAFMFCTDIESAYRDNFNKINELSFEAILKDFVDSEGESKITLWEFMRYAHIRMQSLRACDSNPVWVSVATPLMHLDLKITSQRSVPTLRYDGYQTVGLQTIGQRIVSNVPEDFRDISLQDLFNITSFKQLYGVSDKFKLQCVNDYSFTKQDYIKLGNEHYRIHDNKKFFKKLLQPEVLKSIESFNESTKISLSPKDKRYFTKLALADGLTTQYITGITKDGVLTFRDFPESEAYDPRGVIL